VEGIKSSQKKGGKQKNKREGQEGIGGHISMLGGSDATREKGNQGYHLEAFATYFAETAQKNSGGIRKRTNSEHRKGENKWSTQHPMV